jgi:hypothetical protein
MSALGQKQTCAMQLAMSAMGQKRTFARNPYLIPQRGISKNSFLQPLIISLSVLDMFHGSRRTQKRQP